MASFAVGIAVGLLFLQFGDSEISDPVIVEQLYDDNEYVKSVTKITHLKDGTVEYIVNIEDGMASTDPQDNNSEIVKGEYYQENVVLAEKFPCYRLLEYMEDVLPNGKETNPTQPVRSLREWL